MEAARWERVKEIFSAVVDRESPARAAYLDEACAGDPELRAEVESLVDSHDQPGEFIERPAAQRALGLTPEPPATSWIGRRVGAYRIVAEIGRGGMSEVFMGVRADDEYHKEVAVKVLRPGYDTRSLVERFNAEKQILATLDHPNIARILDGGSTAEGLPYLVMDYIKGLPIDEYSRERRLTVRERVELFRTLCSAVQYVHQRLMVHGDLKCSNVLVAGDGSVRLLDFGVARLLHAIPNSKAAADAAGPVALTPEYASPEQIRGERISTASDVYSLGVMLYRLLADRLPYGDSDLLPHELAARIRELEPLPPSQAVRQSGNPAVASRWRQLAGDLDSIVFAALRKDPAKRYSSVESLNEDIGRHLQGFPVMSRTPSVSYKLVKFWGRHRAGIAAMLLFVLTLIGGIVVAGREAHIARLERARAERHFDEVRKLAQTFMFEVHESIQNLPGATPARHMLVLNSLKYLDALAAEAGGDPSLQRDLAMAYEKVADVQGGYRQANLGDFPGAIASYRKALDIRIALLASQPDLDLRRELVTNYGKLGETLAGSGDMPAAIASSRRALRLAEELVQAKGSDVSDRRNLGNVYLTLGWQLAKSDQAERGLLLMNQGTAVYETLIDADVSDVRSRHNVAVAYGRMGEILIGMRRYGEALRMHTRQFDIVHALSSANPRNADLQTIEAYALLGIATVLSRQGSSQEALEKQTQAMHTLRTLFDADAKDEDARYNAAFATGEVGETLAVLGQLDEAEQNLRDALAILEPSAHLEEPGLTVTKVLQGVDFFRLGKVAARRATAPGATVAQHVGRCNEARRWFEQSTPILDAAEREGQWPMDEGDRPALIAKHLIGCRRV